MPDHNNFNYHIIQSSQFAEALTKGIDSLNYSDDGDYATGNAAASDTCPWNTLDPDTLPQWIKDLGVTTTIIDHIMSETITQTVETSEGASDRWLPAEVLP